MLSSLWSLWTRWFVRRTSKESSTFQFTTEWEDRMIGWARGYIGKGETIENNEGPALDTFRWDGPKGPWCAAFVYHCIWMGCYTSPRSIKRTHGAQKLFRRIGKAGSVSKTPAVGAIACWERGPQGSWKGHVGIVTWTRTYYIDGLKRECFGGIEGNIGSFPSVVTERDWTDRPRLLGFARLPEL